MTQPTDNNGRFARMREGFTAAAQSAKGFMQAQPENWLARCGLALATISAFTSGYGIYQFAVALGTAAWLALPISLGLGLLVQMIVVNAIRMMASDLHDLGSHLIALLIVLFAAWSLSVSSSYGSYWVALAKDSYEQRGTNRVINAAVDPLNTVSIRFANASDAFQNVAAHTAAMAEKEAENGTSCGYFAMQGQGPRFRLRERQNTEAQRLANDLSAQNRTLGEQIGRMNSTSNVEIADAYRLAAATVTGGAVESSRAFIEAERSGFASGFSEGDVQFTCADPVMERYLDNALTALDQLPEIEPTPPEVVRISDSEGMLLSILRMWRAAFDGTQAEDVTDSDMLPLAIPFIVEIIMTALLVLGFRNGGGGLGNTMNVPSGFRRAENTDPHPILQNIARNLDQQNDGYQLYHAFTNHVIAADAFGEAVLVVPRDHGTERELAERLLALADRVGGGLRGDNGIERIEGRFYWDELPASITSGWEWHCDQCDLYRLSRRTVEKMRAMLKQHAVVVVFDQAKKAG